LSDRRGVGVCRGALARTVEPGISRPDVLATAGAAELVADRRDAAPGDVLEAGPRTEDDVATSSAPPPVGRAGLAAPLLFPTAAS
jgi:hypothetical protein